MPPRKTPPGRQSHRASRKRKNDSNIADSDELQASLNSSNGSPHRKKQFVSPSVPTFQPSSPTPEDRTRCVQIRSEDGRLVDSYCWDCHEEIMPEKYSVCIACPRVYHMDCLTKKNKFSDLQVCPECQIESVDGTSLSKSLTVEMLKKLLYALTLRVKKSIEENPHIINNKIFLQWPEELETNEIVHEMALDILQDKVNDKNHPYIKTAEFYSDVKWIYHNCCILYEGNSKQIAAAKRVMKEFKEELLDLEACPECYYHLFCEESDEPDRFVRLCKTPHDIVWAKLKGSTHWPAKCLKVLDRQAHVRFFGKHERSSLKINEMFHISESHPNKAGPPKTLKTYFDAMEELGQYIDIYKRRFRVFKFYPIRTRYVSEKFQPPKERQKEKTAVFTDKRASLAVISQMKSEVRAGCMQEKNNSGAIQVDQDITIEVDPTSVSTIQVDPDSSVQENESIQIEEEQVIDLPRIAISNTSQKQVKQIRSEGLFPFPEAERNVLTEMAPNPVSEAPIGNPVTKVTNGTSLSSPRASTSAIDCDLSESEEAGKKLHKMIEREMMSMSSKHLLNSGGHHILTSLLDPPGPHLERTILEGNAGCGSMEPESEVATSRPTVNFTSNGSSSECTPLDGDDDVVIIEPPYSVSNRQRQMHYFDPSLIVPYIVNQDQNVKSVFQDGEYVFHTLFVRLWALACRCVKAPEAITRAQGEIKKLKAEIEKRKVQEERYLENISQNQEETEKLLYDMESLKKSVNEEHQKYLTERGIRDKVVENAQLVVSRVQKSFNTKWDTHVTVLNVENERIISEKNLLIEDFESTVKQLNDKIDNLNKTLEEVKSKSITERETSNAMVEKSESENIKGYKRNDYCWVCLKPGNIRCCWNTNYCSEKCRKSHLRDHKKTCLNRVPVETKKVSLPATIQPDFGTTQNTTNYVKVSHNQMIQRTHVMQMDTVSSVITPPNNLYAPFPMPSTSLGTPLNLMIPPEFRVPLPPSSGRNPYAMFPHSPSRRKNPPRYAP